MAQMDRAIYLGEGISLPELISAKERYFTFTLMAEEVQSVALHLQFFRRGEAEPVFFIRFGILPAVASSIVIDRQWLDAHSLFPGAEPGALKLVCHGQRADWSEIESVKLAALPSAKPLKILYLKGGFSESRPVVAAEFKQTMVDVFGQTRNKEWTQKIQSEELLRQRLLKALRESRDEYGPAHWSSYGGFKGLKLGEGSGFFRSVKKEGRWWLIDPEGYAFFSHGVDCVGASIDCRVDGVEAALSWLPDETDPEYTSMFRSHAMDGFENANGRQCKLFSYIQANLYKAYGANWREAWQTMLLSTLKQYGLNTLGNWSDPCLQDASRLPYVDQLPEFPQTKVKIFRDFPDVFSPEYETAAERAAEALRERCNDPYMVGYFLRNEPAWAFVDGLNLAAELLRCPDPTVSKAYLIEWLRSRFATIEALNEAWKMTLTSFEAISEGPVTLLTEAALADLRSFSVEMVRRYVSVPARACRAVDRNHMILGMRWAWISDPDLIAAWDEFDAFSINCYAVDPTEALNHVVDLGVDLPLIIGEFHFGALDAGPTATGLEAVRTQADRGKAYAYYVERVAAHTHGVGCHYFQCYDQFALGRFDGENYNIGLFDICSQPYTEMLEQVGQCAKRLEALMRGEVLPTTQKGEAIPMIAY